MKKKKIKKFGKVYNKSVNIDDIQGVFLNNVKKNFFFRYFEKTIASLFNSYHAFEP